MFVSHTGDVDSDGMSVNQVSDPVEDIKKIL